MIRYVFAASAFVGRNAFHMYYVSIVECHLMISISMSLYVHAHVSLEEIHGEKD